jgi:hypothetical protein
MRKEKKSLDNPENKENKNLINIKKTNSFNPIKDEKVSTLLLKKESPYKKFPNYIERESEILLPNYGVEIYNYMKSFEENYIPADFLSRHYRLSETRMRMVDWMLEVFNVFKSDDHTFFLAVHIMDMYLFKNTSVVKSDDIHLLGLTCIFIASKFEDIIPIRMDSIVNKIGHKTFPAYNEFN